MLYNQINSKIRLCTLGNYTPVKNKGSKTAYSPSMLTFIELHPCKKYGGVVFYVSKYKKPYFTKKSEIWLFCYSFSLVFGSGFRYNIVVN